MRRDILAVLLSNWERLGPASILLPALPFGLVLYGAKNPPKSNRAALEATARDKVFIATRLKQKQVTEESVPTPTSNM